MDARPRPRPLQELRAAWLGLGLLLGLISPSQEPVLLGLTLLGWLVGGAALLQRRAGEVLPAAVVRLTADTAGRMTLLVAVILLALVVLLTNLFIGLVVLTWCAAASLGLAFVVGADRLRAITQRAVTLVAAIALVSGILEVVFRLPFVVEQLGRPPIAENVTWEKRYDRATRQNVFGFRSLHQTMRRTPGVPRILALGDSYTWGQKIVSTDSTWPSLLESELARLRPDRPTEVVNISRPGWSTQDEAMMLERIGWQFEPDRLLIQFYLNDHDPPEGDPNFLRYLGRPPAALKGSLLGSSYFLYFLRVKYWDTVGQSALQANLENGFKDGSPGWKRVTGGLHRMAVSARSRGVPVTLVLFAALSPGRWTPATYPYRDIHDKVARAARAEGMEVLDLTSAYAAEGKQWQSWWVTPYDRHPNAGGQLVAARAIAQYLESRGWGKGNPAREPRCAAGAASGSAARVSARGAPVALFLSGAREIAVADQPLGPSQR